ncbi:MAG TPA: DUF3048 domain-containing protein [Candidatus Saccharimonadales bacterium]|jgi:hypothetical protein
MIQDVAPPPRDGPKQKRIEPLPHPERPSLLEQAKAEDPSFKTPEEVAAEDVREPRAAAADQDNMESPKPPKKHFHLWRPNGRKQWIITAAVAVVVLGGAGTGIWQLVSQPPQPKPVHKKVVVKNTTAIPKPIYSDLSGLQITDASLNQKPVTAVMVENSTDARPQSGLSQAGVVFEAQAEGGVTRFMALYQDTAPDNVGPIRSARPYYIQWAMGFDAAYAHVGGSPDALSDLTTWGVQNMDQFSNGNYYHRITTRAAPHNVYTGVTTLNDLESAKGYSSTFTGFPRAATQKPLAQPTAGSINLSISGPVYNPHYDFDPTTNTYKRSTDGTPDTDANTGQQLAPTTVIAIVVPLSQGALDASNAYYSNYNVLGTGTAYVFQNGGVTIGQWHKADNASQLTFTDASGTPIPLNRGQTWISTVSAAAQVKYTAQP